ncbi:transposase [bacterium]|nr:transposase [bacterium]
MGLRFDNQKYGSCFFVTTSFANHRPLGKINGVYKAQAEELSYRIDQHEAKLMAYVFMPSHLHIMLLIQGSELSRFVQNFKKRLSQKTLKYLTLAGLLWQKGFDRQAIMTKEVAITKFNYIQTNPVRAELVKKPEDWYWSSAKAYLENHSGPLPIWKEWLDW